MYKTNRISVMHFLPRWSNGGMERAVTDICMNGDSETYEYSIVVGNLEEYYKIPDLKEYGIRFSALNEYCKYSFRKVLSSFGAYLSSERKYDIVHIHINNSIGLVFSWMARRHSVPIIIVHAHNNAFGAGNILLKRILRCVSLVLFSRIPDAFFACSEASGEWTFGKRIIKSSRHYHVIYNGVNDKKYQFREASRAQIRSKYKLDTDYIIGHVGHFNYQKNQTFIIDVLDMLEKDEVDTYHLFLVGSGPTQKDIMNKVHEKQLDNYVTIEPPIEHVEEYYSMFDVLVMPSKFEGFGMVVVEAQYNGLHVICSDKVPRSTDISGEVEYLPIDSNSSVYRWRESITRLRKQGKERYHVAADPRFDIRSIVEIIENEYSSLIRKR